FISSRGYGEYFGHGLGHGVGLEVHEYPAICSRSEQKLREGMVFTVEPGIYVPGIGGVRIEDTVVVTTDGFECLTSIPKQFKQLSL
ncbi:MAG: aminopeptidase P family protein, partial [Deltaproteobacteria bacterium]